MKIEPVVAEGIEIGARHRSADLGRVKTLAESMSKIGLLQPITVYTPDDSRVVLVAGLHRLEAAKSLDWDWIDCVFIEGDEIDCELAEIAENLHRLDLTKDQRDQHIRRYAELLRAREGRQKPRQDVALSESAKSDFGGRGNKGVAGKVAEATGLSTRTVQRVLNPKPPTARKSDPKAIARDLARKYDAGKLQSIVDTLKDIVETDGAPEVVREAPEGFRQATALLGTVKRFAEFCGANDPVRVAGGLLPHEVENLREKIASTREWLHCFEGKISGEPDDGMEIPAFLRRTPPGQTD